VEERHPAQPGSNPRVVLLYCQHCASGDAEITAETCSTSGLSVQPVMIACGSKVEVPHVLKLLERGADAVEIVTCPEDGCHSLCGSLRAEERVDHIRRLLGQVHIDPERVGLYRGSELSARELTGLARDRAEALAIKLGEDVQ